MVVNFLLKDSNNYDYINASYDDDNDDDDVDDDGMMMTKQQ